MRLVDLELFEHHRTEKAILVSEACEREKAVWLPLSAVEIAPTKRDLIVIVTMPEHLAIEKGLV